MAKQQSGGTPATIALTKAGITFTLHSYQHDPSVESFGLEAATALGLPPEQVFKTLLVELDTTLVVAVVPVNLKLDLKSLAGVLGGKKAAMADPAAAQRSTGYVLGGISPIGQKRPLTTVIDSSAQIHEVVYVSAGRRGLDLGLAPLDLAAITGARFADIARA